MTSLTTYHRPVRKIPSKSSREEAYAFALAAGIEIQVDIDGEPWLIKPVRGDVFARLADDSDRRAGRRCRECGKPHSRVGGFYRDQSWLCSTPCLIDYDDHHDEGHAPTEGDDDEA